MKVLALVGSPRKEGNTDLVIDRILQGAKTNGLLIEKVYLYDFEILPCLDCRACKLADYRCILKDDMGEVYKKLEGADIIIFGTPLYWYGPSGKMKLLIDRLRPYVESKRLKRKKAVMVVPSEEGAQACVGLVNVFRSTLRYLEMELTSQVLVKAYEKGEVNKHPEILDAANQVGRALKKVY